MDKLRITLFGVGMWVSCTTSTLFFMGVTKAAWLLVPAAMFALCFWALLDWCVSYVRNSSAIPSHTEGAEQ